MRLGPLTFAIAATFLPAPAPAQEYPSRPVLFVVPYAAGGGTETMARLLGRRLAEWVAVVAEGRKDQHPLAKPDLRTLPG